MLRHVSIDWFPLLPGWSIALIALALLGLVAWGSSVLIQKQIPRVRVIGLGIARSVAVVLFALCLLQPVLSYIERVENQPELFVLVDTSKSMGQRDDLAGPTRLAAAVEDLEQSKLLDDLQEKYQLRTFGFDRRAYPLELDELGKVEPRGSSTDFARSLASAVELAEAQRDDAGQAKGPRRVLLVSDGNDRGGDDLAAAAIRQGISIDVLVAGGPRNALPGGAAISRVQAARRVMLASETQFLVTVDRHGSQAADYRLTLYEDGQPALTQKVTLAADANEQQVRVAYRPTEVGLKRYEFALQPSAAAADAPDAERYGVNVQVVDDKIEVLVLEDRWRWEFKFFKRVLEDDPSYNLTAMLARGGGAFLQMGEPERRVNLGSFPQSRAELDWFDVVLLGDVRPTRWPAGLSGAIADAVIEGGKSLVLVAGPALGEVAQAPELAALLPVELTQESAAPIEGPLSVQFTPEGAAGGLFSTSDAAATGKLPVVDRIYPALRKRPGATVLVEAAAEANASGRLILMARQTVGRGQVFFVGTDALWKWQTLTTADADGATLYSKFWQQALRALTPNRTAAEGLWLAADHTRYEAGQRVRLQADAPLVAENERAKLTGTVVLPDGRRLPLHFESDAIAVDTYFAEFDALAPGRYRVSLAATVDGQTVAETSTAIEVVAARGEDNDGGVNRTALVELARRTGGQVIHPGDPQTWPTRESAAAMDVDEKRTVSLWDNFALLALLSLVLGADWLTRLLCGYV